MENKKIKLLFDITVLSYFSERNGYRGGIYFVTKNLLEEFSKNSNLDITLICDYKRMEYLKDLQKTKEIPQNCEILDCGEIVNPFIAIMAKLRYIYRKEIGDNLLKKLIRFVAFRCFHFYDKHKKVSWQFINTLKNFDVYFSPYEPIPLEMKQTNIKPYLFLHDAIPLVMDDFYKEFNFSKTWFGTLLNSLNEDGVYFANSEHTKRDFVKYVPNINPENIIVTPLGANDNFYQETDIEKINKVKEKYKIPQDKKYLFSLCTLEPRKNLLFAVRNFVEFIKKNNVKDFIFVLGGGAWTKFLPLLEKNIANFEEYKDKILKIGYVDDEDLGTLFSGAEMFVYPSFYEGFGMPILEAMQCGCPVICSNTSSMPEVIGDCGIMIDPKSDSDLISAFEKMYFDNDFRTLCRQKGLQRAKTFSWEKCANIIIEKIKSDLN